MQKLKGFPIIEQSWQQGESLAGGTAAHLPPQHRPPSAQTRWPKSSHSPHPWTARREELKSLPRPHPAEPRAPSCPRYPLQNPLDLRNSTSSITACEFPPPRITPVLPLPVPLGPCLPLPAPSPCCGARRGRGSRTEHTQLLKPPRMLGAGELLSQHPLLLRTPMSRGWGGRQHPAPQQIHRLNFALPPPWCCRIPALRTLMD